MASHASLVLLAALALLAGRAGQGAAGGPGAGGGGGVTGDDDIAAGACPAACSCSTMEEVDATCELASSRVSFRGQLGSSVRLTCETQDNIEAELVCSELPRLPYGQGQPIRLELVECALPGDVRCVTSRLGAGALRALYVTTRATLNVTSRALRGLDELEKLVFYGTKSASIPFPSAILSTLPSLTALTFNNVCLTLTAASLRGLTRLTFLELSACLTSLPSGLLADLGQLQTLLLFANNIEEITEEDLKPLVSLKRLELSNNRLSTLDGVTRAAPPLRELSAAGNALSELRPLSNLTRLEKFTLIANRVPLTLLPLALADLPSLSRVDLSRCGLSSLPPDLLHRSPSLATLSLSNNRLSALPADVFRDLSALQELDLSWNKISRLDETVFKPLKALRKLSLDYNEIVVMPPGWASGLSSLRALSLSHNALRAVAGGALRGARGVEELRLDHNHIEDDEWQYLPGSPFQQLPALRVLSLSHNALRAAPDVSASAPYLARLDLSHNRISQLSSLELTYISNKAVVDLRHNAVSTVYPLGAARGPARADAHERSVVLLDYNTFHCDCRLHRFVQRVQGYQSENTAEARIDADEARCSSPESLNNTLLKTLPLQDLVCHIPSDECVSPCSCLLRAENSSIELTCPTVPEVFPNASYFDHAHMYLRLTTPPEVLTLSPEIEVLNLTGLNLQEFPPGELPSRLRLLDISGNNFSRIPPELYQANITLRISRNPIACDCWHAADVTLLKTNHKSIEDFQSVNCSNGESVAAISADQLCDTWRAAAAGGALAAIGVLAAVIAAILLKYSLEIRVWLYNKGWCARWFAIDDGDRKYDAFVSFCQKDVDFVTEELIPGLEAPPHKYKLCVHYRDWIPGEWIPAQIAQSVADSRRTIIVVSKNFLDSLWGRAEFRAANMSAIKERKTRVIVVLLEDITSHKELDPELRAYLSTNTYLKWGDPWFWDKIRYAVRSPHKKTEPGVTKSRKELVAATLGKNVAGSCGLDARLTPDGVIVNAARAGPDKRQVNIEFDQLKHINGKLRSIPTVNGKLRDINV